MVRLRPKPACNEVDQLVKSGVVVVVSAGNTGYGWNQDFSGESTTAAGLDVTINDPGNAERGDHGRLHPPRFAAQYGVSFFSSKGPTGDGRLKPDLVAPGERILGPAAGRDCANERTTGKDWDYLEDSGTSMAAPHVSGAIAAFLSVRNEFIGRPDEIKEIFIKSARGPQTRPRLPGQRPARPASGPCSPSDSNLQFTTIYSDEGDSDGGPVWFPVCRSAGSVSTVGA